MKENYPFELFKNRDSFAYLFITDERVIYEVQFKYSPYIFEGFEDVANKLYEFVLLPVEGKTSDKLPDKLIAPTVAIIIKDFLQKQENIVIYICDSSDGKEATRSRKFNQWFEFFSNVSFIKFDVQLADSKSNATIYMSMILKNENPLKMRAFEAFNSLQETNNK